MKTIKPNSIPIGVSNAVQAFALDLAGAAEATPHTTNLYSKEILFALGGGQKDEHGEVTRPSKYAGMSLEEAAIAAHAAGEKGSIHYRFVRSAEFGKLCKAFHDQEKKLKTGETIDTTAMIDAIMEALAGGEMQRAEAVVRLVTVILKTYISYKNSPMDRAPEVKYPGKGNATSRDTSDGGKIVTLPGFKVIPVNASAETRKKLKI